MGWYLVTSIPAISEIYDKRPQWLKVYNGNNSYTKKVLCQIFMMSWLVTGNLYKCGRYTKRRYFLTRGSDVKLKVKDTFLDNNSRISYFVCCTVDILDQKTRC